MALIDFSVYDYPKFIEDWSRNGLGCSGDECLRKFGYESAVFDHDNELSWAMNEEDYTMFILRWG